MINFFKLFHLNIVGDTAKFKAVKVKILTFYTLA